MKMGQLDLPPKPLYTSTKQQYKSVYPELYSAASHSGKEDVIAEQEKTSIYQNLPKKLMKQNSSFSAWEYMHVHAPQYTA
jgi:hypothetical protein